MNATSIRKLNEEDAKALNDFFKSLSKEDRTLVLEDETNIVSRTLDQDKDLIIKQSNTGFLAGIFKGQELIALSTITYFNHIDMLKSMCELGIVVKDGFKYFGYGTYLLNFVIAEAKKDKKKVIELNVLENNSKALNFYLKHGFKKTTTSEENDLKIKTIFMSLNI